MNKKTFLLGIIILILLASITDAKQNKVKEEHPEIKKVINVSIGKPNCGALTIIIEPPGKPRMLCYHSTGEV